MHVFQVAFYGAGVFYALFVDQTILIPFLVIVALYVAAPFFIPGAKSLSTRKKIMQGTWGDPSQPVIQAKVPVRTEKIEAILQSSSKQNKLTMTHFCIKALGQILASQPYLNGILTMGTFVQKQTVDVSTLVDIGGGKDLALLLVKGVDKMSIEDIASFMNNKARNMKKDNGGETHKKQTGAFKFMPAFILSFVAQIMSFIAFKLRKNIPAASFNCDSFGSACVTSLGGMGFQDATAPFTPPAQWTILLSANKAIKQPVVEGDKVVVGNVMNCNFVVDHRYVDGGNCTKLLSVFRDVFQHPQKYMDKYMKSKSQKISEQQ